MGRRRKASGSGLWGTAVLLGGVFATVLILSIVGAIADRINGARYPLIPEIGLGMMILGLLLLAGLISYLNAKRTRTKQRRFNDLLALTPKQFEHAVGHLLHDLGYRHVRHVGKSRDLSADLTATTRDGQSVVIQCKRHAPGSKIGSPDIQKFIGMALLHHRADRGIFVTTAEFTDPAIELAGQHPIDLWNGMFLSNTLERIHGQESTPSEALRLPAQPRFENAQLGS
jgi:restriction system protein